MNTINFILTEKALTVFADNVVYTCHSEDTRFEDAVYFVKSGDLGQLIDLIKPIEAIRTYVSTNQRIEIKDGAVYFDNEEIHNYTAMRMLNMHREGLPIEPIVNFMVNLASNPSKRAVDGLLEFLEIGELPLTPDGHFLAYKRVRANYKDVHSGTIDNSVGALVEMKRSEVQDDPSITCSHGLHFCSLDYLAHFSGERIMVLKINPRDVVSIPTDYNNSKGRCNRYFVAGELEEAPIEGNHWRASVVDDYDEFETEFDGDDDYFR
jgi:hypothetical protein